MLLPTMLEKCLSYKYITLLEVHVHAYLLGGFKGALAENGQGLPLQQALEILLEPLIVRARHILLYLLLPCDWM